MQQVEQLSERIDSAQKVIDAAAEDNAAYHVMLTNPDMLAAYVNDFFGPEGPYPLRLPKIVSALRSKQRILAMPSSRHLLLRPAPQAPAPAFKRPEIDMVQPGVQAPQSSDDFWAAFSALSEQNPSAAWQMLSQAGPDALRSKVLVSEG